MHTYYYEPIYRGKVRDVYALTNNYLLIDTTDRISVFDKVLDLPCNGRGKVLNDITAFWSKYLYDIIPNHYVRHTDNQMVVRRTTPIKIEFVVRKCIFGSFYEQHKDKFFEGEMLKNPILTPTSKSDVKDVPLTEEQCRSISRHYDYCKDISIKLFNKAYSYLFDRGMILCDTKFEFGLQRNEVLLIDEYLTPDSSRLIKKSQYEKGRFVFKDKQILRDIVKNKEPLNKEIMDYLFYIYDNTKNIIINGKVKKL